MWTDHTRNRPSATPTLGVEEFTGREGETAGTGTHIVYRLQPPGRLVHDKVQLSAATMGHGIAVGSSDCTDYHTPLTNRLSVERVVLNVYCHHGPCRCSSSSHAMRARMDRRTHSQLRPSHCTSPSRRAPRFAQLVP